MSTAAQRCLWVTVLGMRWDRLFADLEGEADHLSRVERDALVAELTDETWGKTTWLELLGGSVVLDVRGIGHVTGELAGVHDRLLRLRGDAGDRLIATSAVVEVVQSGHRGAPPTRIDAALGWASALRRLRDADEVIRMDLGDGREIVGRIDAIGQDFVRVEVASGRRRIVVLDAIAVIAASL